jgi:hypothetical protein
MRLYRGIAVPEHAVAQCIEDIRSSGLAVVDGRWRLRFYDLKRRLNDLWGKDAITFADTRPNERSPDWICACAEQAGALYYACHHNRSRIDNTPLLITFDAELKDIIVDGRDFLYSLFQYGQSEPALPVAIGLFGPAISRYLNRAWALNDQEQRLALCDLAIQDESIILAHSTNRAVIAGRVGTVFRNAFMVRAPIAAECIWDVEIVGELPSIPSIDIALDTILCR